MSNSRLIRISEDTSDMLPSIKSEFLAHHPEMEQTRISNNKLIFETFKFYLK